MADFFIILLLVLILLLLVIFKAHLTSKIRHLSSRMDELRKQSGVQPQTDELQKTIAGVNEALRELKTVKDRIVVVEKAEKIEVVKEPEVKKEPVIIPKAEVPVVPEIPMMEEVVKEPAVKEPVYQDAIAPPAIPMVEPVAPFYAPIKNEVPVAPKKKTDFERFIGENLINKIGIAILVIGVGLFVKFAIDKDWINEWGRVGIGLLAGALLLGLGHFMRKSYHAFSSVLVGGGLAVFYFSIAIAFREYHLFSQTVAFIIMVVVTALAVFLALRYNRLELAVISLVGGFATPFMVSNDSGNYIVLFSYLMILNVGMLVLAYFKKWNLINLLSFIFTVLIYGGWLISLFVSEKAIPYGGAMLFASMFFVVFFLMNIVNNLREKEKFRAAEITIIVADTFLYFAAGIIILEEISDGRFQGLFTACLAVFNLAFTIIFYLNNRIDKSLIQLLIGQTLVFISMIAPIQFDGNFITLFWAAEAVLLLWFSGKSGIRLIRIGSFAMVLFMAGSMIMCWVDYYLNTNSELPLILNRAFITGFACVASLGLSVWQVRREKGDDFLPFFPKAVYLGVMVPLFIVFLYIWLLAELLYQVGNFVDYEKTQYIIIDSFNLLFIVGLLVWARIKKSEPLFIGISILALVAVVAFMGFFNFQSIYIRNAYLVGNVGIGQFLWHYVEVASIITILALILLEIKKGQKSLRSVIGSLFLWFFTAVGVFVASTELIHLWVFMSYEPAFAIAEYVKQAQKLGLPILWGVYSFTLLFIGLKSFRMLRIISLSLFFITLLKLAIFDLRGISEAGRIAAFISLGVILLVMSFMYQKVKKLLFDADSVEKNQNENAPESNS